MKLRCRIINGGAWQPHDHPGVRHTMKRRNIPAVAGTYDDIEIADMSADATTIAEKKKELRRVVRDRLEAEIGERYSPMEVAALTAFQTENPAWFTAMKSFISKEFLATKQLVDQINAAATWEELEAIEATIAPP